MTKKPVRPRRSLKAVEPVGGVNERPVDGISPAAIVADAERTVNGIPVSSLPPHVANMITYAMTDQGIAERNSKNVDTKGRPHTGLKVTANAGFDQRINARNDDSVAPWLAADPFKEMKERLGRPGFRYRMLSPKTIDKRTLRGWKPVIDPETKENARCGGMIFSEMPEQHAEQRNKFFRDQGKSALQQANEQMQVNQEKLKRDAKSQGLDVLQAGDVVSDYDDPDRHISIGVHSTRGLPQGADAAA